MDEKRVLRILHTSDWHLGASLYGKKRYDESEAFLAWLAKLIHDKAISVLLISGDVFDTTTPSNRAQELYYRFLCSVAKEDRCHIVITAGNHDSPSFLEAPKTLLSVLNIHVISAPSDCLDDEILLLRDREGKPEALILAVPYLRDRDIRTSEAGEQLEEKEEKIREGIRAHYAALTRLALKKRDDLGVPIPLIAMGHLFTQGGQTVEGDGGRDLYVGKLAHVSASLFSNEIAYVALGHLHIPQMIPANQPVVYSGSPLPMGFNEAKQEKSLSLLEWDGTRLSIQTHPIPQWQELCAIKGDLPHILTVLEEQKQKKSTAWLEITYQGKDVLPNLRETISAALDGTAMEVLQIKNARLFERYLESMHDGEDLQQLSPRDVFLRCLDAHKITEEQRPLLLAAYQEMLDEDKRAE